MSELSTDEKTSIALLGATLIDGTGRPALKDSAIIVDGNIDLTGKTITPGFIDSHLHYFIVSMSVKTINLSDTKSLQETLDTLEAALEATPREDHRHRIEHCELLGREQ